LQTEEAYGKVYACAARFGNHKSVLFSKRIDSTLRGSVGAEVAALSDALGKNKLCLIVPSFPSAGRTVLGGELFLNGISLRESAAASDPLNPIVSSSVANLLRKSMHPLHPFDFIHIPLETIRRKVLADVFRQLYEQGSRFLSLDAETDDDIARIADGAVKSQLELICADPGPLSLQTALCAFGRPAAGKTLLAVGSVVGTTADQVREVIKQLRPAHAVLQTDLLLSDGRQAEISRAARILLNASDSYLLLTLSTLDPANRLDFSKIAKERGVTPEKLSMSVNQALAETVRLVYEKVGLSAVFASGGDIAASVCKAFQAAKIRLLDEVAPLIAFGILDGGTADQLPIVTKGGLVGGSDIMLKCVAYLDRAVRITERRREEKNNA
jgi:uncharacterized protein YgbK (DUF1537 family)